jgi:hypothetical protein
VEKDTFIEVLKHYSESSEEEALEVLSLRESFPYSQMLRALAARVSKDHEFVDNTKELQLAAIYSSDRAVLKNVMTLESLTVPKSSVANVATPVKAVGKKAALSPVPVSETQAKILPADADSDSDSNTLADQVMNDLEKLHQLKHNFEMMFVDSDKAISENKEPIAAPEEAVVSNKESGKSRKARIIELAKALVSGKGSSLAEDSTPLKEKKRENPGENIIQEIATTKTPLEPESEKQKEQLEIIEHFIKTQPSITNAKDKVVQAPPADLATIKTGEFSDNVVSETLVEILIKQGKKDKAIEVLKKLIWKFPQKKAYFAAQIEELKRS